MTAPWRGIEATVHASFDAEDRTTRIGDVDYTYTADGFIASKTEPAGTTRYSYTGLGELSSVLRPDGQRIDYTYDANGLRVAKAIDGRIVERYSWADNTRLLATYDGAGALTRRFLYADARTPYAMDTPAGRRYLAYDQVGSVRALTDESGRVVGTLVHDSFGMVVEQSGEATSAGLGFAAGLSDPDTGLVLFGARDYDPASGRWMAKDPIGFAGGDVNLYGYCLGDPVNLVDTDGLAAGPGPGGGPPPVPVPGGGAGNSWKWNPNAQNSRGGTWGPKRPIPGQGQPSGSWDPEGHWDIDNGLGDRQRYDEEGNPITPEDAHNGDEGCPTDDAANAVALSAASLGVVYVVYRTARMVPSLIPALWWTIPANTAIP